MMQPTHAKPTGLAVETSPAAAAADIAVQPRHASTLDTEGMTVLEAATAYQLLDNPPEPSDELRRLLALR